MSTSSDNLNEELSAYIDGELTAGRQAELTDLLAKDEESKAKLDALTHSITCLKEAQVGIQAKCPELWTDISSKLPSICLLIEEDFSAYLDGELIAPAKEGVSEHLSSCPPCHEKFQNLSQVNGLLSRGLQLSADINVDIWSQVQSRLDEDCLLIKEELSSFYDREVTAQRHRAVTSHLLECGECRNLLAEISQTGELLRTHYQPAIPDDFDIWPKIKAKMQVLPFTPKEKRRKPLNPKPYLLAAAVCAGLLGTITFFVNSHSASSIQPVTAESYLIESALGEPAEAAEAMVYENQ